ncbi:MAG: aminotransferase class IV [Thermoanaerobaculia bacterium]
MTTKPLCCLNGRVQSLEEARIDPLDRGFLFGDALYDVVRVVERRILRLDSHLARLRGGLERVDIDAPAGLDDDCRQLVTASQLETGYLYLQVSRGVAPRAHEPPSDISPTVLILAVAHAFAAPASRAMRAISRQDYRWEHCDLKTTSLLATVMGKIDMRDAGVDEVLFVGAGGQVREGGSSNLFVRQGDVLKTHPADGRILEGVTRGILMTLAEQSGLPCSETPPLLKERDDWQEAFLCGTLTGVQPLVELDGEPIADSVVGPWTQRLAEALEKRNAESS